jgi:hypothetical protein
MNYGSVRLWHDMVISQHLTLYRLSNSPFKVASNVTGEITSKLLFQQTCFLKACAGTRGLLCAIPIVGAFKPCRKGDLSEGTSMIYV